MTALHSTSADVSRGTNPTSTDIADEVGLCVERALAVVDLLRCIAQGDDNARELAADTLAGALASISTELERIDMLVGEPQTPDSAKTKPSENARVIMQGEDESLPDFLKRIPKGSKMRVIDYEPPKK